MISLRPVRALFGALICLNPALAGDLQTFAMHCLQARAKDGDVRILQFGDSHLASAGTQRRFKDAFQAQFGDGGPGFGLPWVKPQTGVQAHASSGWHRPPKTFDGAQAGLQGAWFEAARAGETACLEATFSSFRIEFLSSPDSGRASILVDGRDLGEISTQGERGALVTFERRLPDRPGLHRLEVITSHPGPVRILGVSLGNPAGAAYSAIAANGRQASWLLTIPETLFLAQVQSEAPDLIILAFGTNEANEPAFDGEEYRKSLEALLSRFQKAAPAAAFALMAPPDAILPRGIPGSLDQVSAIQKSVADRHGAFFWDQRAAMGGSGSMAEWSQSGQAAKDRIHFTPEGYQRLHLDFLDHFLARLGQLCPGGANTDGAFVLPPTTARIAAKRSSAPPAIANAQGHPIYVFKTFDGRTIITDDPSTVVNEQGEWVGRTP